MDLISKLKHFFMGSPLPSWEYRHQRLSKRVALAVFSSDALSSVAYATEEILLVLMLAGSAALAYSLPISLFILILLGILIVSYSQTISLYPKGGGSYVVAKDNLGKTPSLIAASALLLDYILTVAVSVAAGVAALTSAFPSLYTHKVIIGVVIIIIITFINLKGVKESGAFFAVPTYLFVISMLAMIGIGFYKFFTGTLSPVVVQTQVTLATDVTIFLILRAFSSGCTALTGIEAISDGVLVFRKPESRNARITLIAMGLILAVLFFGITFIALKLHVTPLQDRTVVSSIAESIFGGRNILFFAVQIFTMLILFLAANTGFADFPRLCFFLARDKFLPRQFTNLGERLVFSNGIILLGFSSITLIILFQGSVHLLIPLYAIGVFTSFTLSQAGMVKKHFTLKENNWIISAIINGSGFIITFVVLIIITVTKFVNGAWMIIVLILLLVTLFKLINRHYNSVARQLSVEHITKIPFHSKGNIFIIFIPTFHNGIVQALSFAKSLSKDVVAVHVKINEKDTDLITKNWDKLKPGIQLDLIDSPYRKIIDPLMKYIDAVEKKYPNNNVTVIIPEFVPKKIWQQILHNQVGLAIRTAIYFRKKTNYLCMSYHLEK